MHYRKDFLEPDIHSSMTLPDYGIPLAEDMADKLPPKKARRWTRRAFIIGGLALGAGGLGVGYAASHTLLPRGPITMHSTMPAERPSPTAYTRPTPVTPTNAEAVLTFTRHQQPVLAVTWSPAGQALASGAVDGSLFLWNTQGNVQAMLPQDEAVRTLAWSPDGQQITAGAGHRMIFLQPTTGQTLARVALAGDAIIMSVAWSPRQPALVVSGEANDRAIVWDATRYQAQTIFTGHTAPVECVSWAADGQTVGSSSFGGVIRVWNAANGTELHGLFLDAQVPMRALAFAPAGDLLAAGGDDGIIRLWNGLVCQQQEQGMFGPQCADMPQRLRGHTQAVRALAWSPDGRLLASSGDDGRLIIWMPMQHASPVLMVQHHASVVALAWSPDGQQIAMAAGNSVTLWRLS